MPAQESIHVLLIDDPLENFIPQERLQSPGYRLIKARSEKEALSYLTDEDLAEPGKPGQTLFILAIKLNGSKYLSCHD